jgi:CRP-like cAMP-binding protein
MNATLQMANRHALFRGLPDATLDGLIAAGKMRVAHYGRAEYIFHEGQERGPGLYMLVDGCVRISKVASSGKETVIRVIRPGEIFAAVALFSDCSIMPATASALEDATVLEVERPTLLALVAEHPEWAFSLLGFMSGRMRYLQSRLHAMVSERAPNRLAQIIVDHAATVGVDDDGLVRQCLTYKLLSELAGITYEETVRIMRGWATSGYLAYGRHGRIRLLEPRQLEALAVGQVL